MVQDICTLSALLAIFFLLILSFLIAAGVGEERADGENTHGPGYNHHPSEPAG